MTEQQLEQRFVCTKCGREWGLMEMAVSDNGRHYHVGTECDGVMRPSYLVGTHDDDCAFVEAIPYGSADCTCPEGAI